MPDQVFAKKQEPSTENSVRNGFELILLKLKKFIQVNFKECTDQKLKEFYNSEAPNLYLIDASMNKNLFTAKDLILGKDKLLFSVKSLLAKAALNLARCATVNDYNALVTNSSDFQMHNAHAVLEYEDNLYIGAKMNGMRHGNGVYFSTNGLLYVGEFFENRFHGEGILMQSNYLYFGCFVNKVKSGEGMYWRWNRELPGVTEFYKGTNQKGKLNGEGTLITSTGDLYEGNFKDESLQGRGNLKYANGDEYSGFFSENVRSGNGRVLRKNGDIFEGNF